MDAMIAAETDPYLWLEDIDGERAMAWVNDRNAETGTRLDDSFVTLRAQLREVLDSAQRIPWPRWHGEHLYNFWQDADHPRGLWRRTTLVGFGQREPAWDVLIDVDALALAEGENWVFKSVDVLRPHGGRAMVHLSPGGGDAAVVREFDLVDRVFVAGGFELPLAKTWLCWVDQNTLFVGTDTGPGSLTSCGYPRTIRRWQRGTPLSAAPVVFEGEPDDVIVEATHDPTPGHVRDIVTRSVDFFHSQKFLLTADGTLVHIDVPDDADIATHREWLLIQLRTPWTVDGHRHPAGSLLAARFDAFLAGHRDLSTLFQPDPHRVLDYHVRTHDHVVVASLDDVRSDIELLTAGQTGWRREPLRLPELSREQMAPGQGFRHATIVDTNPDGGDEYLIRIDGFTQPPVLAYGQAGGPAARLVRQEPESFDATGVEVTQHFVTSDDGTQVPYFVVGQAGGPTATLLTGYGGYQVSLTPAYDPLIGRGWLARGGTYVVANIRGGGEYGPAWHRAAMREHRVKAYQDFAAVARDLVIRGVTTVPQLGIMGRSNGGLLVGAMLAGYPDLFGAVACAVPLLDLRRYHQLLAGASWIAEYGDPDQPDDWAYLSQFSPYHQVRPDRSYPPVLLLTSTRDDRVHPGHARKMAARLGEYGHRVTYYENVDGGHAGAADNASTAHHWALILDFLWRHLAVST